MRVALLLSLILAGCGGDRDCDVIGRGSGDPVALVAGVMRPVGMMDYQSQGGNVTLTGQFRLQGATGARVRLYDNFASTQYDVPVIVENGVIRIPPYTWRPSMTYRTAVLYVSTLSDSRVSDVSLIAEECR